MRRLVRLVLAAGMLLLGIAAAEAQSLITDLSSRQIEIRSNFTGTRILLFGAIEADAADRSIEHDIVIVVRGPDRDLTVRKKERTFGIWMNRESVTFPEAPGYYAVVSSRALDLIASTEVLRTNGIGVGNLNAGEELAESPGLPDTTATDLAFRQALVRNKQLSGLYRTNQAGVGFLGKTLFRADIDFPANVPLGLYTATVYLFRDGQLLDSATRPLYVDKEGLERTVFRAAHEQPLLYGIVAILTAAFAGWLGATLLRERQ